MLHIDRAPLSIGDIDDALTMAGPVEWMADMLAELEARAWMLDKQVAARLIGAARLALREN